MSNVVVFYSKRKEINGVYVIMLNELKMFFRYERITANLIFMIIRKIALREKTGGAEDREKEESMQHLWGRDTCWHLTEGWFSGEAKREALKE